MVAFDEIAPSNQVALPIALLYSELHERSEFDEYRERREGGFSVKRIGKRRYWYHQVWVGGKRIQKALGPESAELLEHMDNWRREAKQWRAENRERAQIVRALKAALRMTTDPVAGRVIARLSERGAFRAGAVLIGTHAFVTYGPMLGVRLAASNLRTGDIDFGAVDLAVSGVQTFFAEAVQSADSAFFIVPARPGSRIPTALAYKGGGIRVELLTPLKRGEPWTAEIISSLQFGAQKAPYLDYLIESTVEATYLAGEGVRVRVPHPARFAWHKLIVAADRPVASHAKALKDVAQSNELLKLLLRVRLGDVKEAAGFLRRRGERYVGKARAGAQRLDPEIKELVLDLLKA